MPTDAEKLNLQAIALTGKGELRTANALLKRANALDPANAALSCNLAISYTNLGDYDAASRLLLRLLTNEPNNLAVLHAYGVLSLVAAHPDDAARLFKRCYELSPEVGNLKFDYSLALMQAGNWKDGLEAYETRRENQPERAFDGLPRWQGELDKTVYVWAEQGVGDTFQFARYLPWLAERSKKVVFALPPDLHALFKPYNTVCELVSLTHNASGLDCETSLMSLARYHGTTPEHVPPDPGFIGYDIYPRDLPTTDKLKVGLCWACNPSSGHYRERSVPLENLLQLAANPDLELYSLQVGASAGDVSRLGAQLVVEDLSSELSFDWRATAAAIKGVDVVVTTDTSVAHLAAILRKPTYMFLARRDWWRWGNEGQKTFWYPTMTIIRQKQPYSWASEVQQVSAILGQAAQARCATRSAA